jgi:Tol biopolymer transport system component
LSNERPPLHSVSADGSRIVFKVSAPDGGQIYMREDGTRTVEVSESRRSVPDAERPAGLFGASVDGSRVLITSEAALTDDAEPGNVDIYRYDVEREELEDLTRNRVSEGSGGTSSVLGISEDASYVYFQTRYGGAEPRIYLFHDGEVRYIATGEASGGPWAHNPDPVRVSPDGRYLVFATRSRISAYDNTDALTGQPDWPSTCSAVSSTTAPSSSKAATRSSRPTPTASGTPTRCAADAPPCSPLARAPT